MKNRLVLTFVTFAILLIGVPAEQVSAETECFKPVFVDCPDSVILACQFDTVSVQVRAVYPLTRKSRYIRYHLVSGPGEVDPRTGVWSYKAADSGRISTFEVEIAASILYGYIRTSGDENCKFEVRVGGGNPRIIEVGGKGPGHAFPANAPGITSLPILIYDLCNRGIEITIESINPEPDGQIFIEGDDSLALVFDASADDAGKKFIVELRTSNQQYPGSFIVVFDTRTPPPVPVFSVCPDSDTVGHCGGQTSWTILAIDPEFGDSAGVTYELISGPGGVTSYNGMPPDGGGLYYFFQGPEYVGQTLDIEIAAEYAGVKTTGDQNCKFTVTVAQNHPPVLSWPDFNPCGTVLDIPAPGDTSLIFTINDTDECNDDIRAFVAESPPDLPGTISVNLLSRPWAKVTIELDWFAAGQSYQVTIGVTDQIDTTYCQFAINGIAPPELDPIEVRIDYKTMAIQGQHTLVDISLDVAPVEIGGFDILIGYDGSALTFQDVTAGEAFFGDDGCKWEYFTYRYGPYGNCGSQCPSGMLRVVGIAETNNGDVHPACYTPDNLPTTMFTLDFLVSNDRTLECKYLPIQFFWMDCGDNGFTSADGNTFYVSRRVYDRYSVDEPERFLDITSPSHPDGYPTYFGAQDSDCFVGDPARHPIRQIDFYNGGIRVACADSIGIPGDVNLNGIEFEIHDALLFARYFVECDAASVFVIDMDLQIDETDIDEDHTPLELGDFVLMLRIMFGDIPPPFFSPCPPSVDTAFFTPTEDQIDVNFSSTDSLGAVLLSVAGDIEPVLEAPGLNMMHYTCDNVTRILIYGFRHAQPISNGTLVSGIAGAALTEAVAVNFCGGSVATQIEGTLWTDGSRDGLPKQFALHQNFPNPFNPTTTISFDLPAASDIELQIFNIIGETVFSQTGFYSTGTHQIRWNGTSTGGQRVSSGVYYYRISADDHVAVRKMILLK